MWRIGDVAFLYLQGCLKFILQWYWLNNSLIVSLAYFLFRIDANVADTELNVEAAHGEILKYFQSVTSNRWLMIKVFLVLIVFFIIFIVFLA